MNELNPQWNKMDYEAIEKLDCIVEESLKDLICVIHITCLISAHFNALFYTYSHGISQVFLCFCTFICLVFILFEFESKI